MLSGIYIGEVTSFNAASDVSTNGKKQCLLSRLLASKTAFYGILSIYRYLLTLRPNFMTLKAGLSLEKP
jgi:hypothetical protein